jgi:hypothetical protein
MIETSESEMSGMVEQALSDQMGREKPQMDDLDVVSFFRPRAGSVTNSKVQKAQITEEQQKLQEIDEIISKLLNQLDDHVRARSSDSTKIVDLIAKLMQIKKDIIEIHQIEKTIELPTLDDDT